MNLETKTVDNILVIYLTGRLDVNLSKDIEIEINNIIHIETEKHLLFNFKDVEYMSSSGIRVIISTIRILEKTKRYLKLCNINNAVKIIFKVIQLMDMFDIYESEEEAIASFKKSTY